MADHRAGFDRLLAVWAGRAELGTLDALVAPGYRGHIGSRDRDLARLKADVVAYRHAAPGVVFRIEHQFGDGDYIASRLTAFSRDAVTGAPMTACGLNISRWEGEALAEEWAVWEPLSASR